MCMQKFHTLYLGNCELCMDEGDSRERTDRLTDNRQTHIAFDSRKRLLLRPASFVRNLLQVR